MPWLESIEFGVTKPGKTVGKSRFNRRGEMMSGNVGKCALGASCEIGVMFVDPKTSKSSLKSEKLVMSDGGIPVPISGHVGIPASSCLFMLEDRVPFFVRVADAAPCAVKLVPETSFIAFPTVVLFTVVSMAGLIGRNPLGQRSARGGRAVAY